VAACDYDSWDAATSLNKDFTMTKKHQIFHDCADYYDQGRTQGGGLGLKPPLELDILRKLYYLRK